MIVRLIGLMLILQGLIACESENVVDTEIPTNLQVQVNIADDGSGKVEILATADNTVEYQLRIGASEQPEQVNATGIFEHTFIQPGNYDLDIRAYGLSGRYLREVRQVFISFDQDISVEDGYTTPLSYEGYNLVWQDEFEGNSINTDYWVFETGSGCPNLCGWGNNELQYYRKENAWVADGVLTIEARRESYQGSQYTSTRMKTQGKKSFRYGRIDVRALLPKGQGIWPAVWMLGSNITSVGWPKCGEIDIMEMIGGSGREKTTHGTLHWDNNGHNYTGGSYSLDSGTFADEFHVFSIIWNENQIQWLMNDIRFHTINITPGHMTEFHEDFFFLLNVAVGGNWPGNPDGTTVFPQQMKVDYIRVFQQN